MPAVAAWIARRIFVLVGVVVLLVILAFVVQHSLDGISDRSEAFSVGPTRPVTSKVVRRAFGRQQSILVTFELRLETHRFQLAAGTVTSASFGSLAPRTPGDAVLSVDGVVIPIARGLVPSYRALSQSDTGPDVEQLQQLLADLDYLPSASIDGDFGRETAAAVRRFNSERGLSGSSVVPLGSVIFVPTLDVPIALSPDLQVGRRTSSEGTLWLGLLPPVEASFVLPPTLQIELGARVVSPNGSILTIRAVENVNNERLAVLDGDIGAFCGSDCTSLGGFLNQSSDGNAAVLPDTVNQSASLVLIAEQTGMAIPVVALVYGTDGRSSVEMADGSRRPVEVAIIQDGWALVTGLAVDDEVRLDASP